MAPEPSYPQSPTRPYASTSTQPQSPTARKTSPMTYNDTDEKEGVIGLGLGLGAAEKGKAKAVSRCPDYLERRRG
jgi:hypothetical protein